MNQAGKTPIVAEPRRWDVLASFMLDQGYKTFVEVGCKEGRTTGHILKNVPDSRVIAIDPWIANPAPPNGDMTREDYEKWDFAKIEADFWANVGENIKRCMMIRTTSADAALRVQPQPELNRTWIAAQDPPKENGEGIGYIYPPIDIGFIDALHDYESVLEDIRLWWPKVRIGGMLCGHDFNHKWPGVERAVADNFNLLDIGVASDSVWFIIKTSEEQLRS